jgi:hypothetical protein
LSQLISIPIEYVRNQVFAELKVFGDENERFEKIRISFDGIDGVSGNNLSNFAT